MKRNNILLLLTLGLLVGGLAIFKVSLQRTQPLAAKLTELPADLSGYVNYSDAALLAAEKKGQPVLFFAATGWCQTCSALEKEIIARNNELPAEVTILKVDYDNDKAMNKKYLVAHQHTLIFLDQDGQELSRSVGDGFDRLLERLDR